MAMRDNLNCDFKMVFVAGESLMTDKTRVLPARYASRHDPRAYFDALRRLRQFAPDLVICSLWRTLPLGMLVKWLNPRVKVVCFLHVARPAHVVDRLLYLLAMRASDAIWFDCLATFQGRAHGASKPGRIISFVTARFRPFSAEAKPPCPRFVSWGRLNRQKGIDRALRLIAELVAQGVDASFDAWGPDDGEKTSLVALAAKLRISDRVHFRGAIERQQLPEVAGSAAFFLQLSRFEGMAMTVVEAMQLGCVPVVTAVGEIATYCKPGVNAIVVEVNDLPAAARELRHVLDDPAIYAALRSRALSEWSCAQLYADDIAAAAAELV
ncbi:MAG TPA: glycosyltransferase family 4 protein [Caulobacteraceae bacterium]